MNFKVGDRVVVYGGIPGTGHCASRSKGTVIAITGIDIDIRFDDKIGNSSSWIVYPQQCRKLVKKHKRRIWIEPFYVPISGQASLAGRVMGDSKEGFIEFVEVRRKK